MSFAQRYKRYRTMPDGRSHNPAKDASDPDMRATQIAEKYIQLMTKVSMEHYRVMPVTGAELNLVSYGEHASRHQLVDYINRTTGEKRRELFGEDMLAKDSQKLLAELRETPVFLEPIPEQEYEKSDDWVVEVKAGEDPDEVIEAAENAAKPMYVQYQQIIDNLLKPTPRPNLGAACDLLEKGAFLIEAAREKDQVHVNPAFQELSERYCNALMKQYVVAPQSGVFSRAYVDDFSSPDSEDVPEITTPPRSPINTVHQLNTIQRILFEATYRGHNDPTISPIAHRMHHALGDFDISYLDPETYMNLPMQINFSAQWMDEDNTDYLSVRKGDHFCENNMLLTEPWRFVYRSAFMNLLPAARIFSIGNRFPYDEAKQRDEDLIDARTRTEAERVKGRMEITNFGDATSNPALSLLPVISVHMLVSEAMHNLSEEQAQNQINPSRVIPADLLDQLDRIIMPQNLPQSPRAGIAALKDGPVAKAMRLTAMKYAELHDIPVEQAEKEVNADIEQLERCVIERQRLLLKQPWGGPERWREVVANGKKIGNPKEVIDLGETVDWDAPPHIEVRDR